MFEMAILTSLPFGWYWSTPTPYSPTVRGLTTSFAHYTLPVQSLSDFYALLPNKERKKKKNPKSREKEKTKQLGRSFPISRQLICVWRGQRRV